MADLARAMGQHYETYRHTYRVVFDCASEEQGGQTQVGVSREGVTFTAFGNRNVE